MHRLPWAIIVAAGLIAFAMNSQFLNYAPANGISQLRLIPVFWSWLVTLVVVVLAFVRMWFRTPMDDARGFDVMIDRPTREPRS